MSAPSTIQILNKIYNSKNFAHSISPEIFPVSINKNQGLLLQNLVDRYQPENIIELGFGFGVSSLWLLSAKHKPNSHTIIDPYPMTSNNKTIYNHLTKQAHVKIIQDYTSQQFLAEIDKKQTKSSSQLIFLDADQRFDGLMADIYFIHRILTEESFLVIRNIWNPAVRKAVLFAINNLNFSLPQLNRQEIFILKNIPLINQLLLRFKFRKIDLLILKKGKDKYRNWNHFHNF